MRRAWVLLLLLAVPARAQDASEVTGSWSGQDVYLELRPGPRGEAGPTARGTVALLRGREPLACELERGPAGWSGGSEVDGDFLPMTLRREGETLVMNLDIVLERHTGPAPAWAVRAEAPPPAPDPAPRGDRAPWRVLGFLAACAVSGGVAWYCRRAQRRTA